VDIRFTQEVDADVQVAPLLFIILLENAIKHGVENVRNNAFVHIMIKSQGKNISFVIENSLKKLTSDDSRGIGLDNLKGRLEILYPNRHDLIIEEGESVFKAQLNLTLI